MIASLTILAIAVAATVAYKAGRARGYAAAWVDSIETDRLTADTSDDQFWLGYDAGWRHERVVRECLRVGR